MASLVSLNYKIFVLRLVILMNFHFPLAGEVEDELLHTYTRVYTFDTLLLMVRVAVLVAVMLTVPIVLFPVSNQNFWT